jgi:hypothetical protein
MPVGKVLSLGSLGQRLKQPEPQPEGWGDYAKRNLGTGLINLVRNLEAPGKALLQQTPEMVESLKQRGIPNYADIAKGPALSDLVQQGIGLSEQQMQPQNLGESFVQRFLPNAITAAAGAKIGGRPISPAIQSAAAGAGLATAAKGLELGPKAEAVADILGSTGWNLWQSGGFPGQLRKKLRPEMEQAFKKAEEEGKKFHVKVPEYEKYLNDEMERLSTGNPGIDKTAVRKAINELQGRSNQIQMGKLTPTKLEEQKKHFYSLYNGLKDSTSAADKKLADIYYRAGGAGTGELNKIAKEHPKFGEPYNAAQDLYKGLDAQNKVRGMFERNSDLRNLIKNPKVKTALLGLGGIAVGKPGAIIPVATGAAGIAAGTRLGRYAARTYDLFNNSKRARELVAELGVNAIKNNKSAFINNLKALDKEADKVDRKQNIKGKVLRVSK